MRDEVQRSESAFAAMTEGARRAVDPEVSGLMLRALADIALHFGVVPDKLFEAEAKRFTTCEPVEVRVPLHAFRVLLRRAIALTGDQALGLRCGLHASESAFDLLAPLVAHVPTLRHAIQETRQFQALAFDGASVHLTVEASVASLRCEFPRSHDETDRSLAEFLVAGSMRMLRAFGCTSADVHAVRFEHTCPSYHHVYTEAFEGKERFSAPVTVLEFAAHLLDRPHLHANPSLHALVRVQAEQRLSRLSRPTSVIDRLRTYLMSHSAGPVPDMAVAARALGVSARTLRRRLAEAGQSYRALTQEMQGERACMMLRNPDFTVQGVAEVLGFNDIPAFHRAFRRWTGRTTYEYRHTPLRPPIGRSGKQLAESA